VFQISERKYVSSRNVDTETYLTCFHSLPASRQAAAISGQKFACILSRLWWLIVM
jgi:hypothetical protein